MWGDPMPVNQDALFFFDGRPGALALYDALAGRLLAEYPETEIRVQKMQIGFYDGHMYACASLAPVRRKAERPDPFLTVTFGLEEPIASPRLVCVPIRANRYTHHALLGRAEDIDGELLAWIRASHDLAKRKR